MTSTAVVRAIPTTYSGERFRSRLEARYAMAFDRLGLRWAYETEGLDLGGVWYLPDFWLPDIRTFFEVKGPLRDRLDKVWAAQDAIDREGGDDGWWEPRLLFVVGDELGSFEHSPVDCVDFVKCAECGRHYFVSHARSYRCRACGAYEGDAHMISARLPF